MISGVLPIRVVLPGLSRCVRTLCRGLSSFTAYGSSVSPVFAVWLPVRLRCLRFLLLRFPLLRLPGSDICADFLLDLAPQEEHLACEALIVLPPGLA